MTRPPASAAKSQHGAHDRQPMAPERWERVHETLHAALERDPSERANLLAAVGRDDPALQREIESLLIAVAAQGPFDELIDAFVAPEPGERIPERLGAWRPIRLLARGGMGAVYLAERADGAYEQRVALKLLPAGTRPDLHARFLAERRILARLRHPNIAGLLDGGTTDDGLPYLVLEYVDGEPLTTYCDRLRLPVDARLRLFLDVCAAVSWAHANLIVHRDIKPANVLVESARADGHCIRLLDFGIAKLLDDEVSSEFPATRADLRLLTPEYAAPEQVRGDTITTATDVYQLGVLLYELLCGRRPHRFASHTLQHIERDICERDPLRPGAAIGRTPDGDTVDAAAIGLARATTPGRLARALEGDLDTIIMHALAKEPGRRYASVDAFAADVRRHLEGLPVAARPDSLRYRAGKFVRRNRAAVFAAAAIAVLLASLVVTTAVQNRRIEAQRDRAEQAAGFLTQLFEDLEPVQARGSTLDPREILDRATERVMNGMADQPLLQARLFDVLGRVYQMRGFFTEAEPLLRRALALRTDELGNDRLDVADSHYALAQLLFDTDRHAAAEPELATAASILRQRLGPSHPRVAAVEIDQALARRAAGDLDAAASIMDSAIAALRVDADARLDLATALLYAGKLRVERGDASHAEPLITQALDIRRSLFGDEHPTVANALDGIGEMKQALGDHVGAEAAFRQALAVRRTLFPPDHADLGVSFENLGIVLHQQRRRVEAVIMLDSALNILLPALGPDHMLVRVATAYRDSART